MNPLLILYALGVVVLGLIALYAPAFNSDPLLQLALFGSAGILAWKTLQELTGKKRK